MHIVRQGGRQVGAAPKAANAFTVLGLLLRVLALQQVATGPRMGVDKAQRLVFGHHVAQHLGQHQMLEHVGMVAGVEGVSIGQHGGLSLFVAGLHCSRVDSRRS